MSKKNEQRKQFDTFCTVLMLFCGLFLLFGCDTHSAEKNDSNVDDYQKAIALERIAQMEWSGPSLDGSYTSPIDFDALRQTAPEAIGWLDLSQIGINYPVMYRDGDREFYLHHNERGDYAYAGSIYIEDYNRPDFTDFATVIYGHNMKNNTMFGYLEETYRTEQGFEKGREFCIYLPDKTLHYEVVAAVHHNNRHVLMNRDFSVEGAREKWLHDMLDTTDGRFNQNLSWNKEDCFVVLATCTYTKEKRYLVVAKLMGETTTDRRLLLLKSFSQSSILAGLNRN